MTAHWLVAVAFVTVVLLVFLSGNQPDEERDPFDEREPSRFRGLPQLEEVVMIVGVAVMIVAIASGAA